MSLLIVEDDAQLARSLAAGFREFGYAVSLVSDGESALTAVRNRDFDAIVVDRVLPGIDGLEFVRIVRDELRTTPVIFLSSMDGVADRVQGLNCGADDYLVKPFVFAELLARVRVLTRRSTLSSMQITAGAIQVDLLTRTATRFNRHLNLSPREFSLLEYFVRHANQVLTRKMLLENVWNLYINPHTSIVESHICRLRMSLNSGCAVDAIQTIRGVGYKLVAE